MTQRNEPYRPAQRGRFLDTGQSVYQMLDEILVECPGCRSCACIRARPDAEMRGASLFAPRRLVCGHCGCVKEWEGSDEIARVIGSRGFH